MGKFRDIIENYEAINIGELLTEAGMTVQDIAKDMGITRQYAHRALKSAMGKMWKQAKKVFPDDPPFKLVLSIMKTLGIDDASQEDINSFVGAFPEDIQKEIKKDAVQFLRKKKNK